MVARALLKVGSDDMSTEPRAVATDQRHNNAYVSDFSQFRTCCFWHTVAIAPGSEFGCFTVSILGISVKSGSPAKSLSKNVFTQIEQQGSSSLYQLKAASG